MNLKEIFWRDRQLWLQDCGYMLRPRFIPGWIPSWKDTGRSCHLFEDEMNLLCSQHVRLHPQSNVYSQPSDVIDATVISDGTQVIIKKVKKSVHPYEADFGNFFSSEPLASDLRNHCVPIRRVLQAPDDNGLIFLVMARLRSYQSPCFETFGEAVDFFTQTFEGLEFMHDHHAAHRDCNRMNIMMDATRMYPQGYHFSQPDSRLDVSGLANYYSRTRRPPRYYLIDLGISRRYNPANGSSLEYPIWGGDKSVPEFQESDEPCDPFPTDTYYLRSMIREDFIEGDSDMGALRYSKFKFILPLVAVMTDKNPAKRPTIHEVVKHFQQIQQGLGSWKLRSQIADCDEHCVEWCCCGLTKWNSGAPHPYDADVSSQSHWDLYDHICETPVC